MCREHLVRCSFICCLGFWHYTSGGNRIYFKYETRTPACGSSFFFFIYHVFYLKFSFLSQLTCLSSMDFSCKTVRHMADISDTDKHRTKKAIVMLNTCKKCNSVQEGGVTKPLRATAVITW